LRGTQYVTETMQLLGLKDTFLTRPFSLGKVPGTPTPTPLPEDALKTDADQVSTEPDLYSQTTAVDLGWLLSGLYQCAMNGTGPIATTYSGDVTTMECRQIINAMHYNKIGSLSEAGVPLGTNIAHKHGWNDDTHGDAALVMTPGGDYVLVIMMHQKGWLASEESFPVAAEISRLTYNTFNLNTPLQEINLQTVPADCTAPDQLIADFTRSELPSIK
jgi:beta-lactamase class A